MKKRLLILGMVLVMATATGCGESGNTSSGKSNSDKSVASEQTSEKDTSVDSEDGQKDAAYKSADDITMDDLMNHEETSADDFEFEDRDDSDHIILDKYVGNDPIVVIPDEINGKKVIRFDAAFLNNKDIVAVRIGNNVEEVDDMAFVNCEKLKYVVLGNSVKSLGGGNFVNTDLKELVLNDGLENIGKDLISNCLYAPAENDGMELVIPESVKTVYEVGFSLKVKAGSTAEAFAKENNLIYTTE